MRIAVYTVCRDEERNWRGWLASCAAADHVTVADTGSTDGTYESLRQLASPTLGVHRISVEPWRFDDARNAALALVPADVDACLSLDLDERLYPGWREAIERAWVPGTTNGSYTYVFNHRPDGSPDYVYVHDRLHSRHGWRWRFPDHEGLYPDRTPTRPVHIPDLRLDQWQDREKDRGGTLERLELGLRENPDSPRMVHYLGRELYYRGRYREAIDLLQRYTTMGSNFPVECEQNARALADCWKALTGR